MRKVFSIILFLFLFFCSRSNLYSQDTNTVIKNIQNIEKNFFSKPALEKVTYYLKISKYCENISYLYAIQYAEKALMYANISGNKEALIRANSTLGGIYNTNKLFNKAIDCYNKALNISNNNTITAFLPDIYLGLGNSYNYMGDFQKAIEYYLTGSDICEKTGKNEMYISFQISIGTCFAELNDLKNSLEYFKKGLSFSERTNNQMQVIVASNNMANVFYNFNEYDDAITYYKKAINSFPAGGSSNALAVIYNNIGECYIRTARYDSARLYLEKGLEIRKTINSINGIARSFQSIGNLYNSLKNPEKASEYLLLALDYAKRTQDSIQIGEIYQSLGNVYYESKNNSVAMTYYLKSINVLGNPYNKIQSDNYYYLYLILKSFGRFDEALKYYEKYSGISDSIYSTNNLKAIAGMKVISDIKQRELELERFENQERMARIKLYLLVGLISTIVIILVFFINRQRIVLKIRKLENIKLAKELDNKKKELIEYAGYIVMKNEILENIKSDIDNITSKNPDEDALQKLTGFLKNNPAIEKDKQDFQMKAEEMNQIFYQKLSERFPDLTEKERKLAGYLMLGLSSKEIASILNVASTTIDIRRSQLRQKLGIRRNEEISLFLQKI